jgi:hypothetical protein
MFSRANADATSRYSRASATRQDSICAGLDLPSVAIETPGSCVARERSARKTPLTKTSRGPSICGRTNAEASIGRRNASASPIAKGLYQKPPQFATHGVEDDPEGVSFWRIKHGIRLTGMPSFGSSLSDEQIWTLALFLKHMDKLPPAVQQAWQQVQNWPPTGSNPTPQK